MIKIYWTYKQFDDVVAAIAISEPISDLCFCLTSDEKSDSRDFGTVEEATHFLTEINKPIYYQAFGGNYELIYLDSTSELWYEVYKKWVDTKVAIFDVWEYVHFPWYKKLWHNISKGILK
jgi:hypothetical protein